MTTINGIGDTSGKIHMVVFQQNHIKKTYSVINASSDLYGSLLQHTHARRCLSRIQHPGLCTFKAFYIFTGHRCDTTHALHDVQHQTFGLQKTLYLSCNHHRHITRLNMGSILYKDFHLHGRIKTMEHFFGYFYSGQDTFFLDQQF